MKNYRIAVIAGDGIGPDVLAEGIKILNTVAEMDGTFSFEFTHFPWGCEYYLKEGRMMPENGLEILKEFDAIYLGAVGFPGVPDHISLRELLLVIRKGFDEYVKKEVEAQMECGATDDFKEGVAGFVEKRRANFK